NFCPRRRGPGRTPSRTRQLFCQRNETLPQPGEQTFPGRIGRVAGRRPGSRLDRHRHHASWIRRRHPRRGRHSLQQSNPPRRPLLLRKPASRGATAATGELSNARRCVHGRHPRPNGFPATEGDLAPMNFPGLDPAYTVAHHAAHLTRLIKTWSLPETRAALEQGEKVLVVATTPLGDSILTTPLVETLSAELGSGRVSMLVKTPYLELYQDDPRLHRVFSVRGKYRWGSLQEKLET